MVALLVVFGLAIDALIHFFNRLRLEERIERRARASRSGDARVLVGPAIILTTLVLAFGLGVTVFSDLPSLRTFGFVCGTTLLASLIADLVFLPATDHGGPASCGRTGATLRSDAQPSSARIAGSSSS